MTGSVILPVKSLMMNLLTLSATFGMLVLSSRTAASRGSRLPSQGALELTQPIVLFALVFGLSTDYGVFLLSRIKEARDRGPANARRWRSACERTGRIVTAAALLFCVAIGAFATSKIIFIKELGLGTALAVLIDATIVRALLVPSLMALLGRWNWWAPAPLRRLHDRFGDQRGGCAPRTRAGAREGIRAPRRGALVRKRRREPGGEPAQAKARTARKREPAYAPRRRSALSSSVTSLGRSPAEGTASPIRPAARKP